MGIEEGSDGVQTVFFLVPGEVVEVIEKLRDGSAAVSTGL